MGQMLESSDFEQPATDPSIISIESSTKNLEEPKGLEKTAAHLHAHQTIDTEVQLTVAL